MFIGYARLSTKNQLFESQIDILKSEGCKKIFKDIASGARTERPGLNKAIKYCREGDILVVVRLDRMGRSMSHLIKTIKDLEENKIGFKSINENINTNSPEGRLIFHLFSALSEFEKDLIRERVKAGLSSARARGRKGGRPPVSSETKRMIKILIKDKTLSVKQICDKLKIARSTLYKHLKS